MNKTVFSFVSALVVGIFTPLSNGQTNVVKPFASAKEALEAWQKSADESDRRVAFQWLEMNALTCSPKDISEAFLNFSRVAVAGQTKAAFTNACMKRSALDVDPSIRQTVLFQLADWHLLAGEGEQAANVLLAHLKAQDLPNSLRMTAVNKAAQILASQLSRPGDATSLYESTMAAIPANKEPLLFAELANARAAILHTQTRDLAGAEADSRRVLALGTNCSASAYAVAADRLAAILLQAGNTNEAVSTLFLVLKHPALPAAGSARKIIDSGAPPEQLEEAVNLLRSRMAVPFTTTAEWQSRIERIQPEIVELLLVMGRPDEAVRECRAFALSTSDKTYPAAVELAARCLKSLDGDLGRANALLEFHSSAPPPAGAVNPFLDFPALADSVRAELARQTEKPPTDWTGWINRSALLVWLDRPADAMDAARQAFVCCPMSSNTLQACANAVARPALVATRDPALGQRLADFLLLGTPGVDGRTGTDDDIADPFPEARRRMAYAVKPAAATLPQTK